MWYNSLNHYAVKHDVLCAFSLHGIKTLTSRLVYRAQGRVKSTVYKNVSCTRQRQDNELLSRHGKRRTSPPDEAPPPDAGRLVVAQSESKEMAGGGTSSAAASSSAVKLPWPSHATDAGDESGGKPQQAKTQVRTEDAGGGHPPHVQWQVPPEGHGSAGEPPCQGGGGGEPPQVPRQLPPGCE